MVANTVTAGIFCPICVRTVPHTPLWLVFSLKMWVSLLESHQHAWIIRQLDAHRPLCANSAHVSSSFFIPLSQHCVMLWLGFGTKKRLVRLRKISRFCSKYLLWSPQTQPEMFRGLAKNTRFRFATILTAADPTSCFFMLRLHFSLGSGFCFFCCGNAMRMAQVRFRKNIAKIMF